MKNFLIILLCCFHSLYPDTLKTVAIVTYQVADMPSWDPDTIKSGIVGGEESVIYVSQELAKLGYKVSVFGNAPLDSAYSGEEANPRFISHQPILGSKFDVGIAWRMPGSASDFRQIASKVYLWPHDILVSNHGVTAEQATGFDDVLWLSEWQRMQWCYEQPAFSKYTNICGNGIDPQQFQSVQERKNLYSCIYGSNYARGLEIMLDIWPVVKLTYLDATLDIYYGWQHWGLLAPETEKRMRKQIVDLAPLGVREHGLVGHEELNRAYGRASFWTYPCIMSETFCITALRAQLSGCIPVVNEGSALAETVRWGFKSHAAKDYLAVLLKAMGSVEKITLEERKRNSEFVLQEFTWEAVAHRWKRVFDL